MFKLCSLTVGRLLLLAVLLAVLLAGCDNPSPSGTPVTGDATGTPLASKTGFPTPRPPTKTPDLNTAEGHLDSGNTHFQNNEFDQAIADYTEAIKLQPDLAPAFSDRATTYVEVKEYDKA